MASQEISAHTALAVVPAVDDLMIVVDVSDTTDAPTGTTKKIVRTNALGQSVNAQTGTSYTVLTADFFKLVTFTNAAAIAVTLPQAGVNFPAGWFCFVQNRGAGAVTITPTTSTIDGAATLVLNQNEGVLIVSDGTNYFTMRGKPQIGVGGAGDVTGPGSSTDNAVTRFDSTTGKLLQNSSMTCADDLSGEIGYINIPQNSQSADYPIVLVDRGKHIFHPVGDNNPRTFTIPANGSIPFAVGTAITFVNMVNVLSIAITSDTLIWAEDGSTGTRTLASNGIATAIKVTTTSWLISGTGLS